MTGTTGSDHALSPKLAVRLATDVVVPNWKEWSHAYGLEAFSNDERQTARRIPKLICLETDHGLDFKAFLSSKHYSVGRLGDLDTLKCFLSARDWSDVTATDLDKWDEAAIKQRINKFGPQGARSIRSLLTKVAAFSRPDDFVMMDSFSVKGMTRYRGLPHTKNKSKRSEPEGFAKSIAKYTKNAETIADQNKEAIDEAYEALTPLPEKLSPRAFSNRLVDVYLMALGGRFDIVIDGVTGALRKGTSGGTLVSPRRLASFAILVPEYDPAIAFFTGALGFSLIEDTDLGGGKRWVRVGLPGAGTEILLARAVGAQQSAIGQQGGGRVWLFLETEDFDRDYAAFTSAGVVFEAPPRDEPYGRVAVFSDPWGNRWDLIQYSDPVTRGGTAASA